MANTLTSAGSLSGIGSSDLASIGKLMTQVGGLLVTVSTLGGSLGTIS